MPNPKRVLVANRGEIAVRIVRACRKLGIATVAVHSDADATALHVRQANEAIRLGPAPSRESYLAEERVLAAARASGADAIHPGYGFLSENAAFARRVVKAGLTWIGPSPEAMEAMGDKVSARRHAQAAGLPVAPGSPALEDAAHAKREAERIGYPVLLKASAGGGGIGMRVVRDAAGMAAALESARAQAESAFGVPDVFMEKYLERPRHIEVQVLGDRHGNVVHLFERECSIQRRHQKLVEEAPSSALTHAQRTDLGAMAVALASRIGYTNAGTMEFLFQDGEFHFNEMNTRLQVEHPVTEMVTGIDLVEWQLRIAAGERLAFQQADVRLSGHAIELRINAEDPANGFMPSPGPVERLRLPTGPGIRCDTGLYEGWRVPDAYDSLVLKLVAHAEDRAAAIAKASRAVDGLEIGGFATNRPLHRSILGDPAFMRGDLSTRYLEERGFLAPEGPPDPASVRRAVGLAAALAALPGGLAAVRQRQRMPAVVEPRQLARRAR